MKNFVIISFLLIFIQPIKASDNFYDLFMSGQKKEAIDKLNLLVINGDQDAKYIMGLLYNDASTLNLCDIKDFCVSENTSNYDKAYEIFSDLYKNKNDPRAAYAIGEYYDNHWVFWPNYKKAFKYYLFAAERGVPEAQYNVANMYEFGDGVRRDLIQSVRWYLQCNIASLCGAGVEGIDDLIAQLSKEDFEYAKSLIISDMNEVDIRITASRVLVE